MISLRLLTGLSGTQSVPWTLKFRRAVCIRAPQTVITADERSSVPESILSDF